MPYNPFVTDGLATLLTFTRYQQLITGRAGTFTVASTRYVRNVW
jgi:hypothetical protein